MLPPGSQIGPITPAQRQALLTGSLVAGVYEKAVDRESAYEVLRGRTASAPPAPAQGTAKPTLPGLQPGNTQAGGPGLGSVLNDVLFGTTGPRGGHHDGLAQTLAKSALRTMGSSVGKEIIRGVLGGIFGGKSR